MLGGVENHFSLPSPLHFPLSSLWESLNFVTLSAAQIPSPLSRFSVRSETRSTSRLRETTSHCLRHLMASGPHQFLCSELSAGNRFSEKQWLILSFALSKIAYCAWRREKWRANQRASFEFQFVHTKRALPSLPKQLSKALFNSSLTRFQDDFLKPHPKASQRAISKGHAFPFLHDALFCYHRGSTEIGRSEWLVPIVQWQNSDANYLSRWGESSGLEKVGGWYCRIADLALLCISLDSRR